jgi:hypothetical protein
MERALYKEGDYCIYIVRWCLMLPSTIFQLYRGSQFYWWPVFRLSPLLLQLIILLDDICIYTVRGRHGRDCMVVGFTTTYAISAYHHWCCEFKSRSGRGVQHYVIKFVSDVGQVGGFLYTTLCDQVCQWRGTGWWFSLYNIMWSSNQRKPPTHVTDKLDHIMLYRENHRPVPRHWQTWSHNVV